MGDPAIEPRPGCLLVATFLIVDQHFHRAVVQLLEHNEDGSLGVVLNRPSDLAVVDALPQWGEIASRPAVLFEGGPVAAGGVLALGRAGARTPASGWEPVGGGLATVDLTLDPGELGGDVAELRLFSGYAGWGPEQLDAEIAEGAWWVFPAEPDDAFSDDPAELWWTVVGRQGGEYRMYAHAPLDPSLN